MPIPDRVIFFEAIGRKGDRLQNAKSQSKSAGGNQVLFKAQRVQRTSMMHRVRAGRSGEVTVGG